MARKDFVASFVFNQKWKCQSFSKPKQTKRKRKKRTKFRPRPTNHAAQDEARQQGRRSRETDEKPSGNKPVTERRKNKNKAKQPDMLKKKTKRKQNKKIHFQTERERLMQLSNIN